MYEMYPDAWSEKESASFAAPGRASVTEGVEPVAQQPRRRARKEHQVAPRVLRTSHQR